VELPAARATTDNARKNFLMICLLN
jgi:hypothetical protein